MKKLTLTSLSTDTLIALSKQKRSKKFDKVVQSILLHRFCFYPTYLLCRLCNEEEKLIRKSSLEALSIRLTMHEELFEVNSLYDALSQMDLDLIWPITSLGQSEVVKEMATSIVLNYLDERGYFKEEDHKVLKKKGKDYYD